MKDEIESKAFHVLLLTVFITRNDIELLCLSTNIDEVPIVILGGRVMVTTLPIDKRKSKLHAPLTYFGHNQYRDLCLVFR